MSDKTKISRNLAFWFWNTLYRCIPVGWALGRNQDTWRNGVATYTAARAQAAEDKLRVLEFPR